MRTLFAIQSTLTLAFDAKGSTNLGLFTYSRIRLPITIVRIDPENRLQLTALNLANRIRAIEVACALSFGSSWKEPVFLF
jgi:hypothetical protein